MKIFISIYLMLCGITCMFLALAANRASIVFISGFVAICGALFLTTTKPYNR